MRADVMFWLTLTVGSDWLVIYSSVTASAASQNFWIQAEWRWQQMDMVTKTAFTSKWIWMLVYSFSFCFSEFLFFWLQVFFACQQQSFIPILIESLTNMKSELLTKQKYAYTFTNNIQIVQYIAAFYLQALQHINIY